IISKIPGEIYRWSGSEWELPAGWDDQTYRRELPTFVTRYGRHWKGDVVTSTVINQLFYGENGLRHTRDEFTYVNRHCEECEDDNNSKSAITGGEAHNCDFDEDNPNTGAGLEANYAEAFSRCYDACATGANPPPGFDSQGWTEEGNDPIPAFGDGII